MSRAALTSTANDTKWRELRQAMLALPSRPSFRCKDLNGFYSGQDREWFYHFQEGGYDTLRYVDLLVEDDTQRAAVLKELKSIGMAGQVTEQGFRVYGYSEPGEHVEAF